MIFKSIDFVTNQDDIVNYSTVFEFAGITRITTS
jgi:hypothetical protein